MCVPAQVWRLGRVCLSAYILNKYGDWQVHCGEVGAGPEVFPPSVHTPTPATPLRQDALAHTRGDDVVSLDR